MNFGEEGGNRGPAKKIYKYELALFHTKGIFDEKETHYPSDLIFERYYLPASQRSGEKTKDSRII